MISRSILSPCSGSSRLLEFPLDGTFFASQPITRLDGLENRPLGPFIAAKLSHRHLNRVKCVEEGDCHPPMTRAMSNNMVGALSVSYDTVVFCMTLSRSCQPYYIHFVSFYPFSICNPSWGSGHCQFMIILSLKNS